MAANTVRFEVSMEINTDMRMPEWVGEDLERLIRDMKIRSVQFYDDTLNTPHGRVEELCEEIFRRDLKFSWSCFARAEKLDRKTMVIMKKAGCFQYRFGIEVGSDERMSAMGKKGVSLGKIQEVLKEARTLGIETYSNFLLGAPGETLPEAKQTIDFARRTNLDLFSFSAFYPYPGAPYTDEILKSGSLALYMCMYEGFDLEGLFPDYQPDKSLSQQAAERCRQYRKLTRLGFVYCATNPRWLFKIMIALFCRPIVTMRMLISALRRFRFRFKPRERLGKHHADFADQRT